MDKSTMVAPVRKTEILPVSIRKIKDNPITLLVKSNITIRLRRLNRSAIAPPSGASKSGILDMANMVANSDSLPVVSKTYRESANLSSADPRIEIIWPRTIKRKFLGDGIWIMFSCILNPPYIDRPSVYNCYKNLHDMG